MDVNNLTIEKFLCGEHTSAAQTALASMLKEENVGVSYADMMRYRVANRAADQCIDVYYVAHENGIAYSRLWNGWGRHSDAIGNFGNFVTLEELRGQGLGHRMLDFWFNDLRSRDNKPICLLCMGEKRAAKLYFPYGFKTIEKDAGWGPLFMPLGDSPTDFAEFCDNYYLPADHLISRPATVEWRHEIDCLLKYSLWNMDIDYTVGGKTLEQALMYHPNSAHLLFTEQDRCVGWSFSGESVIHPKYAKCEIIR